MTMNPDVRNPDTSVGWRSEYAPEEIARAAADLDERDVMDPRFHVLDGNLKILRIGTPSF